MFKDNRRRDKFNKSKAHFDKNKHATKSKKEMDGPRVRPAEDRGRSGGASRKENARIAEDTLEIVEKGSYTNQHGAVIDLKPLLDLMATVTYIPDMTPVDIGAIAGAKKYDNTEYLIKQQTTLEACQEQYELVLQTGGDGKIGVLNFASAKNPGGGFLKGSSAQEESLARASALYESIHNSEMYDVNGEDNNNCLYSHHMIYSENVPVFRDDSGSVLNKPYLMNFFTAPAVNTKEALKRGIAIDEINQTMHSRIDRLFSVAVVNGITVLVLGAWGCGIFGGDFNTVSTMFMDHLTSEKYSGRFSKVVFALLSDADIETMKNNKHYQNYAFLW